MEPFARMADCLRSTLATNKVSGRAIVLESALGAVNGEATFAVDEQDFFAGRLAEEASAAVVSLMTLGQVCRELSLDRIDFIKMDIEGAELRASRWGDPSLAARPSQAGHHDLPSPF